MDLRLTEREAAFQAECRAWLRGNVPRGPALSGDTQAGFDAHRVWERALFDAGFAVVNWPEAYGGRGATPIEWLLFEEAYYAAGAPPRITQNGIFLLGPSLFEFGTPDQQTRYLRRMAAAEDLWCQGWSEPGSGSDLSSVRSRATRVETPERTGWLLSGQKTWCTRGAYCNKLFGLFRTNPDVPKHKGLTYFLVALDAPGVTVRPVERLDGDPGFAEVFFDEVFVPDTDVLGGVDRGWNVAMATTSSERGLNLRSPGRFLATVDRLIALWKAAGRPERHREALARAYIDAESYRLFTLQMATRLADGESIGAEASLSKVFWSELDVRLHETAMGLLAAGAEFPDDPWVRGFMFSLAGPIYAGTNEIQRNIVAERLLGLPRRAG